MPTTYFVFADNCWVDIYCRFHIFVVEIYSTSHYLDLKSQSMTRPETCYVNLAKHGLLTWMWYLVQNIIWWLHSYLSFYVKTYCGKKLTTLTDDKQITWLPYFIILTDGYAMITYYNRQSTPAVGLTIHSPKGTDRNVDSEVEFLT